MTVPIKILKYRHHVSDFLMKVTSVQYLKPARAVDAGNLIALVSSVINILAAQLVGGRHAISHFDLYLVCYFQEKREKKEDNPIGDDHRSTLEELKRKLLFSPSKPDEVQLLKKTKKKMSMANNRMLESMKKVQALLITYTCSQSLLRGAVMQIQRLQPTSTPEWTTQNAELLSFQYKKVKHIYVEFYVELINYASRKAILNQ